MKMEAVVRKIKIYNPVIRVCDDFNEKINELVDFRKLILLFCSIFNQGRQCYNQLPKVFSMLPLVTFCLLLVSLKATVMISLSQNQQSAYYQWKSQYARSYQSGEVETYRLTLWLQNFNKIEAHNAKYEQGLVSYGVALNDFADMPRNQISSSYFSEFDDSQFTNICTPDTVIDQDQGQIPLFSGHRSTLPVFNIVLFNHICAAGWAAAASHTLSVAFTNREFYTKNSNINYNLSPQQLIDCTNGTYHGFGCNGGSVFNTWLFYKNAGLITIGNYPYVGVKNTCNISKIPFTKISGCVTVSSNSEFSFRKAVARSPVTAQINGNCWEFLHYSEGIFNPDGTQCTPDVFNHAVSVLGYDYQTNFDQMGTPYNVSYWGVVNSFGTSWGQSGKMRVLRQINDTSTGPMGLYAFASYPLL